MKDGSGRGQDGAVKWTDPCAERPECQAQGRGATHGPDAWVAPTLRQCRATRGHRRGADVAFGLALAEGCQGGAEKVAGRDRVGCVMSRTIRGQVVRASTHPTAS